MSNPVVKTDLTLRQLFEVKKADWHMGEFDEFPLTLALVDASQHLSIQVHPDISSALRFEKDAKGKTESWIFLEPPTSGWIYCGLSTKSLDMAASAIETGVIDTLMLRYPSSKGDCVTVRSGTPHALTAGSLVFEVEFGSNYTYRLFDYNRCDNNGVCRKLDVEKGLAALRLDSSPEKHKFASDDWLRLPEYEIRPIYKVNSYINESDRLECVSIIMGTVRIDEHTMQNCFCVLLEPGEELADITIEMGMIVRLGQQYGN